MIATVLDFLRNYWISSWMIPALILILFIILSSPLERLVFYLLEKMIKNPSESIQDLMKTLRRPLRLFIVFIGLAIAMSLSPAIHGNIKLWPTILKIYRSCLILFFMWVLTCLESAHGFILAPLVKRLDLQINDVLLPFISKVLRFVTIAIALLIIAQEWNYSVSSLLAGLGLGGLAFALAAQDMLANLFGGAVIVLDKPFKIGDWIKTDDVEGTVEDINFRSVKVRTFTQAVVTVPNTKLVNQPVTNFSRMGKRRVTFNLGLTYDTTPEQLKACSEDIKEMLRQNEDIDQDTIVTVFDSFGDSSINLMVVYYTKTTNWLEFIAVREQVFYSILDIVKKENAEIAFPTQTIHIKQ